MSIGDGSVLKVAATHPFWVCEKGWVSVGQLKPDDCVLRIDDSHARVEKLVYQPGPVLIYNITVDGLHNYFVGDFGILVHNRCAKPSDLSGSEDFASRRAAFREAKRQNGVPMGTQPVVKPNIDPDTKKIRPGRIYEFKVDGKTIEIRDDFKGHVYPDDPTQNRGSHFNDPAKNHYNYPNIK